MYAHYAILSHFLILTRSVDLSITIAHDLCARTQCGPTMSTHNATKCIYNTSRLAHRQTDREAPMAPISSSSAVPAPQSIDSVNSFLDEAIGPIVFIFFASVILPAIVLAFKLAWYLLCNDRCEEDEDSTSGCGCCCELCSDGWYVAPTQPGLRAINNMAIDDNYSGDLFSPSSTASWLDCSSVHCSRLSAATPLWVNRAAHYGTM
jgi:hypothetical protein